MSGLVEFMQVNGRKVAINPAQVVSVEAAVTYDGSTERTCTAVATTGMAGNPNGAWPLVYLIDASFDAVAGPLGLP